MPQHLEQLTANHTSLGTTSSRIFNLPSIVEKFEQLCLDIQAFIDAHPSISGTENFLRTVQRDLNFARQFPCNPLSAPTNAPTTDSPPCMPAAETEPPPDPSSNGALHGPSNGIEYPLPAAAIDGPADPALEFEQGVGSGNGLGAPSGVPLEAGEAAIELQASQGQLQGLINNLGGFQAELDAAREAPGVTAIRKRFSDRVR